MNKQEEIAALAILIHDLRKHKKYTLKELADKIAAAAKAWFFHFYEQRKQSAARHSVFCLFFSCDYLFEKLIPLNAHEFQFCKNERSEESTKE